MKTLFSTSTCIHSEPVWSNPNGPEPSKVPDPHSPPDCKSFLDWRAEWLTDRPRHSGRKRGGATEREGCVWYNASTVLPLVTERSLYCCAQSVCAGGLTEQRKRQRVRVWLHARPSRRVKGREMGGAALQWYSEGTISKLKWCSDAFLHLLSLHLLLCIFVLLYVLWLSSDQSSALQYPEINSDFKAVCFPVALIV